MDQEHFAPFPASLWNIAQPHLWLWASPCRCWSPPRLRQTELFPRPCCGPQTSDTGPPPSLNLRERERGRERERDEEKLDVCDHMGSWNYKLVLSGKLLFFIVIFILKNIQCDQATFFFPLELRLLMKELQRHGGCLLMCFLNEILKNSSICLQNCSDGIQTPKQTQIFQLSRYIPDECNSWTNWMDISFLSPSLTFFCFLPKLTVKYMWIFASHYVYNEKIYKCLPLITDDCWNCQGVDIFTNCWWAAADWVMMFSQR